MSATMTRLRGLSARTRNENIVLEFSVNGTAETVTVPALELADALYRLEAPAQPVMRAEEHEEEPDDLVSELVYESPLPWQPPYPSSAPTADYIAVEVETLDPEGLLVLRRVLVAGPDLLEFDTPSGSVYAFVYPDALRCLRPLLPH